MGGGFRVTEQLAELEPGLVKLRFAVSSGAFEHGCDFIMLKTPTFFVMYN